MCWNGEPEAKGSAIAGRKEIVINKYVSERIVNIAELESYIEKAYISIELLADEIKQIGVNNQQVIRLFNEAEEFIKKAKDFEFCVERRTTQ